MNWAKLNICQSTAKRGEEMMVDWVHPPPNSHSNYTSNCVRLNFMRFSIEIQNQHQSQCTGIIMFGDTLISTNKATLKSPDTMQSVARKLYLASPESITKLFHNSFKQIKRANAD